MERSIILVLTLVTLVTATPHGYGVKGGASAKAEASAVAGAFPIGPIPLSIPSGAAYSGSFSKSSASSFAASSASASSSSYSFSGSGVNGISDIGGGEYGQKGCPTGACSGSGSNGAPHFGGANVVASAQAKALAGSYTPCQGSKCNNFPATKCSSGQCPKESGKNSQNGCETGNCKSNSETETSSENGVSSDKDKSGEDLNDTNDFAVNINRNSPAKSSQDSNGQNFNKQNPSESSCSDGKCGPSNSYSGNVPDKQNYHPAPATYLTTPNHNEPCTTPNCDSNPSRGYGSQAGPLPSSYNVPIQSATNAPNSFYPSGNNGQGNPTYSPSVPCTSPYCNSAATSNIPNNYHSGQQQPKNGNCEGTDCADTQYTGSPTKPSYEDTPGHSDGFGNQPLPGHSANQYGLTHSPGYSSSTKPTGIHGSSEITKPYESEPVNHYNSAPTSNAGGPAGGYSRPSNSPSTLFNPTPTSGYGAPKASSISQSSITHPYNGIPTSAPTHSLANVGDTGSYNSHSGSNSIHGSNGATKPNIQSSPRYTGGFGAPAGTISKPYSGGYGGPAGHTDESGSYKPGASNCGSNGCSAQPDSYGHTAPYDTIKTKPAYTGGFGAPAGPIDGSSPIPGSYKPGASDCGPTGCYGQPDSYGHTGASPYDTTKTKPAYTGGFGAPAGPIDGSSSTHGSYSPGTSNCAPTGCNGQPGSYGHTGTTPSDTTKTKPAYTGGFGAPAGPIDGSIPILGSYKPGASNCGPTGCNGQSDSYGHTGTTLYDTTKTKPAYTGGFGAPAGPIDGSSSTHGSYTPPAAGSSLTHKPGTENCGPAGCNGQPKTNSNTASSSQTKPAYTGGFGGPTGFLKPNDFSVPSSSPSGNAPCTSGNCPKGPSSNYNLGHSLTNAPSLASATANANSVAYSGGFGGPPGVLKPFDDGKVNGPGHESLGGTKSPDVGAPSTNAKNSPSGYSPNGGNSGAHAIASATASAGSYVGNNNDKNGNGVSGGCNNGCPNNGVHGDDGSRLGAPNASAIASAKSIAGANSFGFGGSFASSSASAHATAGSATKGGYGRK